MKAFIDQLFLQSNFVAFSTENTDAQLFINNGPDGRTSYWITLKRETLDLLEEQAAPFNKFKGIVSQQDFDKNCSLLLLIERSSTLDDQEFKKKILLIEDNPYYFKKYVLCYTAKELEELIVARNNRTELGFLERHMVSRACFDAYKKDPYAENWQSLVFRTALKIPFTKVKVEVKPGLSALFEDNRFQLEAKNVHRLDDAIRTVLFDQSIDELSKTSPHHLLEILNLKKLQNGYQNPSEQNPEL